MGSGMLVPHGMPGSQGIGASMHATQGMGGSMLGSQAMPSLQSMQASPGMSALQGILGNSGTMQGQQHGQQQVSMPPHLQLQQQAAYAAAGGVAASALPPGLAASLAAGLAASKQQQGAAAAGNGGGAGNTGLAAALAGLTQNQLNSLAGLLGQGEHMEAHARSILNVQFSVTAAQAQSGRSPNQSR